MANLASKNNFVYPSGTTASRPTSVNNGFIYFNTTIGALQIYQNGSWYVLTNINAPGAPTSVTATDQGSGRAYNNGQASISFTPATETYGFPATYTVTSTPGSYTATGTSSPILITGLQSSTQYTYVVNAANNTGSTNSSASSGVTATTVPQAPTIGTATGADSSATLTFTAGATGGSAITNYKYSTDGSTYTAFSPAQTTSPLSFSGLTNGNSYAWYLKAVNSNGDSAASSISNSVTPAVVGSFESIATFTPSGTNTVNFTSIPGTYKHLQLRFISQQDYSTAGDFGWVNTTFNGTSSTYVSHWLQATTLQGYGLTGLNFMYTADAFLIPSANNSPIFGVAVLDILDYANTSKYKVIKATEGVDWSSNGQLRQVSGYWNSTNAITSITLTAANGNFKSGSHFALYGIKG